jgi:hypothetical protein
MFAKVKDAPGFVRGIVSDKEAKPILNVNNSALAAYKKNKDKDAEINSALNDINTMKADINEIKNLLMMLSLNRN